MLLSLISVAELCCVLRTSVCCLCSWLICFANQKLWHYNCRIHYVCRGNVAYHHLSYITRFCFLSLSLYRSIFLPLARKAGKIPTEICIQKTHWCTDWCRRSAIRLICMRLSRDLCLTNEMWLVGLMNGSSNQWKVKPVSKSTRKTTVVGNQMRNNLVYVS